MSLSPADMLATMGEGAPALGLPPDVLAVERTRSISDRLAGRPGPVERVTLTGPDLRLTLRRDGARVLAEAVREVRGVVISRRTVPVSEWAGLFDLELAKVMTQSQRDQTAASQALVTLGLREPGADLEVSPADIAGGLRALPARLEGRLPDDVIADVQRIGDLLIDALPRIEPDGSRQAYALVRTATDYLPRTLRGYLALPGDFAATHDLGQGSTALDALREQLGVLESAVRGMRDAAIASDANEVLANGIFLTDRFGGSALDDH